jgi:hypothetical protein
MASDKSEERRIRKLAEQRGYGLHRSRKMLSIDNHGLYMLADDHNYIVCVPRFDATLEECEAYLREAPLLPRYRATAVR